MKTENTAQTQKKIKKKMIKSHFNVEQKQSWSYFSPEYSVLGFGLIGRCSIRRKTFSYALSTDIELTSPPMILTFFSSKNRM